MFFDSNWFTKDNNEMKRLLKNLLRIILGLFLLAGLVFALLYAAYNQPIPTGTPGPEADALAKKMLTAINYDQYKETRFMEWSYAGGRHHYKWDKENGKVAVRWDNYKVNLNLSTPGKSEVWENGSSVRGDDRAKLIEKATAYFNNDSFWLVAPFKIFDRGTDRSLVSLEDGSDALMVTYGSGGTTPGDTYLWKLGPNGFPESYQMWVKIIPIGGLEASWDDWKVMENGLFLPASHKIGPVTLFMGEVRAYR